MKPTCVKEAVGVFTDQEKLDQAVADLESTAFPRHHISVLGNPEDIKETFGTETIAPAKAGRDPRTPRSISIRPEERTIGASVLVGVLAYLGGCAALLSVNPASSLILMGAVATGSLFGGALGALILFIVARNMHQRVEAQVRKGGLLLWVKITNPNNEVIAKNILKKNGASKVHVHATN